MIMIPMIIMVVTYVVVVVVAAAAVAAAAAAVQSVETPPDATSVSLLLLAVSLLRRVTWCKPYFDEAGTAPAQPLVKLVEGTLRQVSVATAAFTSPRYCTLRLLRTVLVRTLTSCLVLAGPSKRNPVPDVDGAASSAAPSSTSSGGGGGSSGGAVAVAVSPRHSATSPTSARHSDSYTGVGVGDVAAHLGPSNHLVSHHELASRKALMDADIGKIVVAEVANVGVRGDGSPCRGGVAGMFSSAFGLCRPGAWLACDALVEVRVVAGHFFTGRGVAVFAIIIAVCVSVYCWASTHLRCGVVTEICKKMPLSSASRLCCPTSDMDSDPLVF